MDGDGQGWRRREREPEVAICKGVAWRKTQKDSKAVSKEKGVLKILPLIHSQVRADVSRGPSTRICGPDPLAHLEAGPPFPAHLSALTHPQTCPSAQGLDKSN